MEPTYVQGQRGIWGYGLRSLLYLLLIAGSLAMLFPFLWMVISSLKPDAELFTFPPELFPDRFVAKNYLYVFRNESFAIYLMNSMFMVVAHICLNLFFASLAGYCFARLRFPGRTALFLTILLTMMIPSQATLVPLYIINKSMPLFGGNNILGQGGRGWIDSYWGLIIPHAIATFSIFLCRQFFVTLPKDLEDSARIDGASEFRIYRQLVLPLSTPVMATLGIFTFQGAWNSFLWPLIIARSEELRVLQVGIAYFREAENVNYGPLLAASTMATAPVIVVFFLAQRWFKKGIVLTGQKG